MESESASQKTHKGRDDGGGRGGEELQRGGGGGRGEEEERDASRCVEEQRFNKESDVVLGLIKGSVRDFNFRAGVHQLQLSKCRQLNVREVEKKEI